jgi:hypothetical protein
MTLNEQEIRRIGVFEQKIRRSDEKSRRDLLVISCGTELLTS